MPHFYAFEDIIYCRICASKVGINFIHWSCGLYVKRGADVIANSKIQKTGA